MRKILFSLILSISLTIPTVSVFAEDTVIQPTDLEPQDQNTVEAERYSSGKGSYRAPSGVGTGANPVYRTGPRAPSTEVTRPRQPAAGQPPAAPTGWGRFFGGVAAGALLGHLLNPFGGFGYGGGVFSVISILFWILIIYLGYKIFQRMRRGSH